MWRATVGVQACLYTSGLLLSGVCRCAECAVVVDACEGQDLCGCRPLGSDPRLTISAGGYVGDAYAGGDAHGYFGLGNSAWDHLESSIFFGRTGVWRGPAALLLNYI